MAKQVILAVAGAGKTYHICHEINPEKRNLILAFTHENIHNIQQELTGAFTKIPELTTVETFDAFVYHSLILPYEPSIGEFFGCPSFRSNGITTIEPPQKCRIINGKPLNNNAYINKDKLGHYVSKNGLYYCERLSELALQVKNNGITLIERSAKRLNGFYDNILVDEFQDFREYDYDLVSALSDKLKEIVLVGDYYQHSVSGTNNSGKPFKNGKKEISYEEFIGKLRKKGFEVDTTILSHSRRCSSEICNFVSEKLGIRIAAENDHSGSIIWADERAKDIIDNPSILKLVYAKASDYTFSSMNWSYSKGDTFNEVCVILTPSFERLADKAFTTKGLSTITINKLYVAMTRSKGNLYLIKDSTFKQIKDAYIKKGIEKSKGRKK